MNQLATQSKIIEDYKNKQKEYDINSALSKIESLLDEIKQKTGVVKIDNLETSITNFPDTQKVYGFVDVENFEKLQPYFNSLSSDIKKLNEQIKKIKLEVPKTQKVSGKVSVDGINIPEQKEINIEPILKGLALVVQSIKSIPTPKESKQPVLNIPETKIDLSSIEKAIASLGKKIDNIKFPKIPDYPEAVTVKNMPVGGGGSSFVNSSGEATRPLVDEYGRLFVNDSDYTFLATYDGNDNMIYGGWATPGTVTTAGFWKICRFTYDANGNILTQKWAHGDTNFDNTWNDKTTYAYS